MNDGITLPDCDALLGRKKMSIPFLGTLCIEPAADQSRVVYMMPTLRSWSKDYWYVWLIFTLIVLLSLLACVFQCSRWCHRIKHRQEREMRKKRLNEMPRLTSTRFRGRGGSETRRSVVVSFPPHTSHASSESLFLDSISDNSR
ncbi:hypothetical protein JKF63_06318 [Porcisia hertigi]|uniref:Uncharacterized protein n=1 Tax=Porcisia hertigi TaxID=2761500 RepID=A0A836IUB2_9TRYP|nr:hypothetical protein JKF63_06318 [Porcisia hertigi]